MIAEGAEGHDGMPEYSRKKLSCRRGSWSSLEGMNRGESAWVAVGVVVLGWVVMGLAKP